MLISIGSIPCLQFIFTSLNYWCKIILPTFCLPISISNHRNLDKVCFSNNPACQKAEFLQTIILFLGSLSLALQVIYSNGSITISDYFVKVFFSYGGFLLGIISMQYRTRFKDVEVFCNRLCNFERIFVHTKGKINQTGTV